MSGLACLLAVLALVVLALARHVETSEDPHNSLAPGTSQRETCAGSIIPCPLSGCGGRPASAASRLARD